MTKTAKTTAAEVQALPVLALAPIIEAIGAVNDIQEAATLTAAQEAWKANREHIADIFKQMSAMITAGAKTETVVNDFKAQFKTIVEKAGRRESSCKALRAALNSWIEKDALILLSPENVIGVLEVFSTQEEFYASHRKPSTKTAKTAKTATEPTTTERVGAIVEAIRLAGKLSEADHETVLAALKANQMTDKERAEALALAAVLAA